MRVSNDLYFWSRGGFWEISESKMYFDFSGEQTYILGLHNIMFSFKRVLCRGRAGAHIIGTNCHFDAETSLKAIRLMKEALEREGYSNTYLMTQPLAYWTNDCNKQGFIDLPEFPFGK